MIALQKDHCVWALQFLNNRIVCSVIDLTCRPDHVPEPLSHKKGYLILLLNTLRVWNPVSPFTRPAQLTMVANSKTKLLLSPYWTIRISYRTKARMKLGEYFCSRDQILFHPWVLVPQFSPWWAYMIPFPAFQKHRVKVIVLKATWEFRLVIRRDTIRNIARKYDWQIKSIFWYCTAVFWSFTRIYFHRWDRSKRTAALTPYFMFPEMKKR